MAKKKNKSFNSKKKTTTKKSNSTVKKSSTRKKVTSTTKKKSTAPKKGTTTTAKKVTTPREKKEESIKLVTEEPIKVEKKPKLPKQKTLFKDVSKNDNKPERVLRTEEYTVIKKDKAEGKKKVSKSNATKVEKSKNNNFLKKINKLRRKIKMYGINSVIPIKYIFVILAIVAFFVITAFVANSFTNPQKIDLSVIPEKIDQMTTVRFDIDDVPNIISSTEAFTGLKDIDAYDFRDVIGLNSSHVVSYAIKVNKTKKQAFIAIKPSSEYYDEVKSTIEKFLKELGIKDYVSLEYQGYQIFIKSVSEEKDNEVVSKIKQSKQRVFNIMKDLKKDDIERELKISDSDYDEALVKAPMVVKSDTCGYVIIKPKNQSSKEKIKNLMEDYYRGLEARWQNNEENKKLVQDRYFEEYKGYLIYIVSRDNNLVVQLLKSK